MKTDFKEWISLDWDWKEIQYQINAGTSHKQDRIAIFQNCYSYVKQKIERYIQKTGEIPQEAIDEILSDFRMYFPKADRFRGVSYFDDFIEDLLAKYKEPQTDPKSFRHIVKDFDSFIGDCPFGSAVVIKNDRYYFTGKTIDKAAKLIWRQIESGNFRTDEVKEISTRFHEFFNIGTRFKAKSLWETIARLKKQSNAKNQ